MSEWNSLSASQIRRKDTWLKFCCFLGAFLHHAKKTSKSSSMLSTMIPTNISSCFLFRISSILSRPVWPGLTRFWTQSRKRLWARDVKKTTCTVNWEKKRRSNRSDDFMSTWCMDSVIFWSKWSVKEPTRIHHLKKLEMRRRSVAFWMLEFIYISSMCLFEF